MSNNHKANQSNRNKSTSGTNNEYQKVLDNKSVQKNPKTKSNQTK